MKIRITNDHMDRGIPMDPHQNPIALAIKDQTGQDAYVTDSIIIDDKYAEHLPYSAWRWLADFSQERPINEFDFEIKIRIKVTQDHIDEGKPGSPCDCPIALAVREIFPDDPIWVELFIDISDDLYHIPRSAQDFIDEFDNQNDVEPFSFDLEPVPKRA